MPGVTGIIRRTPYEGIEQDLDTMLDAMRHESRYSTGKYISKDVGLYVGWVSHPGSFADCMPLVSPKKGGILIFQGENYLDAETRSLLRNAGRPVDEQNARYIVDLWDHLGGAFLRRLNGWFCGLVIDADSRTFTLFNDRYGMGRIYFHQGEEEFIFASEAKALLRIRPALRTIDLESLAEYLRFNCVTRNKTLFNGISLLPHAASWHFSGGDMPMKQQYFDFGDWDRQNPSRNPEEFYGQFVETLSRVIPAYAASSGRVAISLTAGLDTRAIMASLRPHGVAHPCYTFSGPWGELFDARGARRIAGLYGQPFETIRAGREFLKDLPRLAQRAVYISDGTHDVFGAHDVYLNKVAHDTAPVRLTGKFGSEIVRARNLIPSLTYQRDLLRPELQSLVEALPPFRKLREHIHPLTRIVSEEIPWHEFGRVCVEQSQLVLRTPYMDNELVELMFQAPPSVRAHGNLQEQYIRKKAPELASIPTDLGRLASDNRLVEEFARASYRALFKAEYIYLYTLPHWLTRLDRMFKQLQPERMLSGRQKWEAYRIWLTTDLADFVQDIVSSRDTHFTQFFERTTVEKMVTRHTAGTHNYASEINRVLTVELICSSLLQY